MEGYGFDLQLTVLVIFLAIYRKLPHERLSELGLRADLFTCSVHTAPSNLESHEVTSPYSFSFVSTFQVILLLICYASLPLLRCMIAEKNGLLKLVSLEEGNTHAYSIFNVHRYVQHENVDGVRSTVFATTQT